MIHRNSTFLVRYSITYLRASSQSPDYFATGYDQDAALSVPPILSKPSGHFSLAAFEGCAMTKLTINMG
jgi:hypothetical protein